MAGGEPAHPVGADCYRYRPPERVQQTPQGEPVRRHLRHARDDGRGDEHGQKSSPGIQPLAPLHHPLPARLLPARTLQQPPPPAVADGIAGKPACLTSDDRHHDHRRQVQPPLAGGHRGGPRAVVPMSGTPAQEAATARNSSRYCHDVLSRPAAMRSRLTVEPAVAGGHDPATTPTTPPRNARYRDAAQ